MTSKQNQTSEINSDKLKRKTNPTERRYDRIAPFYDLMEWITERSVFQDWRNKLWSRISPGKIMEVGVGTGKNIPYYPKGAEVTAIDLSKGMLIKAKERAITLNIKVDLQHMDVQRISFPDNTFDTAVATFVFCSVPNPIKGLQELKRVIKKDGDIWLLEHVRVNKPVIGPLMDIANPLVVRIMGANINRQTVENVKKAGLQILSVEKLKGNLVKLIHCKV
ncbi:MAG: methyltransferase type 11 [Chloroflexi bacterium 44-23]|nr:MAG: methyltransferase type 11 [Chloroflexi bacterium 44-23]